MTAVDFDKIKTGAALLLIDAAEIADQQQCEHLGRDLLRLARSIRGSTDHADLASLAALDLHNELTRP